ncbi:CIR protein PIR protein [Plasmodium vinckei brucechwatti]|uniref:CIR protein PIR protein n=1 Tax=Plasmodium vinckei brucechwatti TaxID=119398 RepID=A0A6V7RZF6_PLAVN|nr:CIR protein PIR protein [Plasmodium vinckei brucechwatti]
MAKYNIEKMYGDINTIDGYFYEKKQNGGSVEYADKFIRKYCPNKNGSEYGTCMNYFQMARSGVIHLLENLEKYNLEYEKLAEYAILFLSYKLKQHSQHKYKCANLNNFYTDHIEKNNDYNKKIKDSGSSTYKEIIDKKKDLMNTNEISKFNGPFSILVLLYNEIKKNNKDCTNLSKKANEFVQNFEKLNDDSNINGNTSYRKLLSTLSDDYDNFKSYYAEKCNGCKDIPTLPKIKTPLTKLIPVLSTFPVIPVFLGIAYKYSLFGVDKLFQRQYLRTKLKKVKKKLKLNI